MNTPAELRYSKEHEWVRIDGTRAVIGITDYAQDALGDVVYVEVPDVGTQVGATDKVSEVESTKSVSDIYAPVSGVVVEVNGELTDNPQRVNEDPYGEGWLCIIEIADTGEYEGLMDAAAYRALVES
jgi:glycine cleavage system H protein